MLPFSETTWPNSTHPRSDSWDPTGALRKADIDLPALDLRDLNNRLSRIEAELLAVLAALITLPVTVR